jgi:hypothetical protein
MPDESLAIFASWAFGVGFEGGEYSVYNFVDGAKLLVATDFLGDFLFPFLEDDEVRQEVEESGGF